VEPELAEILSFADFVSEICKYWDLDPGQLDADRSLEDLGIDSLGKLDLIVMLEDFAGHEMPDELWTEAVTLAEIYASYEVYASRDRLEVTEALGN
jgi:acyl carrier protein